MATDPKDPTTVEHQPVNDRVMEVSKLPDGTPSQNPGYEVIDPDAEEAEEPEVQQVSGVVGDAADLAPRSRRRSRKADAEEAVER